MVKHLMALKILDIGAGDNPHPKATHAIDLNPPSVIGRKGLNYYPIGIDVEKKRLPYPSNFFDRVVSEKYVKT